jgi:hypothetical protein
MLLLLQDQFYSPSSMESMKKEADAEVEDLRKKVSELERRLSMSSDLDDLQPAEPLKAKLRVNVKLLGDDIGRIEVCTNVKETFGQFLSRLKLKRSDLKDYDMILSDHLNSEFAPNDRLFDFLVDKDTVVLAKKGHNR